MADIQQPDGVPPNVVEVPLPVTSSDAIGSKRQRRPSVRLGDIGGDQPFDSLVRRPSSSSAAAAPASKQWKHQSNIPLNPSLAASATNKSSKTRAVTNLGTDFNDTLLDDEREAHNSNNNLDGVSIGSWKVKDFTKRGPATKRVRSNWVSKIEGSSGGNINEINGSNNDNTNNTNVETEDKYSGSKDNEEFDIENSESPMKEQSPIHSLDNLGSPSDSDTDMRGRCEEDGVTVWLNSLGLGRYAPVFQIHEVDDEVLPLLTLEDLKDMGINAVGSRRKMFCAIQKLGKGFS